MLSRIDRYIAFQFLTFFVGGLVVILTLFLAADFVSMTRFQAPLDILLRYYTYYSPNILYQLIPAACLIAALFTLTNMNKANELVALFSLGHSLARVSAPILVLSAIISVVSFFIGDRALPVLNQKRDYVYYVEVRKKPGRYQTVKTNRIWYRSENIIFNIQSLEADMGRAQGLNMYYFDDEWNLVQLVKAKDVKFLNEKSWELANGTLTLFVSESSFPLTKPFDKKVVQVSEDIADIRAAPKTSEIMSLKDLSRFISKNKELGLNTLRFETDYHAKMAFAAAGFMLVLLGIPFTTKRERSGGNMVSIAIACGLAAGYWMSFGASVSLGYNGILPPLLAAWAPNFVLMGSSAYMLLKSPV
ncbi:MAG: LPS export ABC transporter permease LptG [Bdellovibrionota bacterium]